MSNPQRKAPRRSKRREDRSDINTHTVACPPTECKPMDPFEKKLSLLMDGLVDVIDTYLEAKRQRLANPEQQHPPEFFAGFLKASDGKSRGFQIQSSATAGQSAQEPPLKSPNSSQPEGGAL